MGINVNLVLTKAPHWSGTWDGWPRNEDQFVTNRESSGSTRPAGCVFFCSSRDEFLLGMKSVSESRTENRKHRSNFSYLNTYLASRFVQIINIQWNQHSLCSRRLLSISLSSMSHVCRFIQYIYFYKVLLQSESARMLLTLEQLCGDAYDLELAR